MNGTRYELFAFAIVTWLILSTSHLNAQVSAGGLIERSGRHLTVITDAVGENEANELIAAFDAAVPQWAAFWKLPDGALDKWQVVACIIKDKELFYEARLIPRRVPDFPFGYALNNRIWVMHQESDYYTRHLLLHEGVHSLAFFRFGGAGPSWFMEGTAEMLSVHTGSGTDTKINQLPASRESVPFWGRFKVMANNRKGAEIPSLKTVMAYPRDMRSDVKSYGWSWAATMLLSQYPEYQRAFYSVAKDGADSDAVFNAKLKQALGPQWPVVEARWRLMCHDLDYGFDWSRESAKLSMNDKLWTGTPMKLKVAANQGWQSIGVRLKPGMTLDVSPAGRCILAKEPKPWVSEPPGVTIRYNVGRPLGQLIACIVPNVPDDAATLKPLAVAPITRRMKIPIKQHCWMLFRVNDALGELADNEGGYTVDVAIGK